MNLKKWKVARCDKALAVKISEEYNLNVFSALLATSRGIKDIGSFFFGDPFELSSAFSLPDMEKAVERINKAIDMFEKIAVYGDYDADGITATALLYSYLSSQGANVIYKIPERSDGYGLNYSDIDEMCREDVKLIITVDNGISAHEQAQYIHNLDIDLIITDHHRTSATLPNALAVVDPWRDDCECAYREWAGVGVALKLVCALEDDDCYEAITNYAHLAAIGTVADIVKLDGENRLIVKHGLKQINNNPGCAIEALKQIAGNKDKTFRSGDIAFTLAPRINAAGRMGHAEKALKLLLCNDEDEAAVLAQEIEDLNKQRQELEMKILNEVESLISENPLMVYDKVLIVSGEGWHEGVLGIVASRLVEKYARPAIVISTNGESARGSCRSLEGFSIYDALCAVSDTLTVYGGHTLAAGLSLETKNLNDFRLQMQSYTKDIEMPFPVQNIDVKLNPRNIDMDILDAVLELEPFGKGNEQPVFGLFGLTVCGIQPLSDGKHIKVKFLRDGYEIEALKFNMTAFEFPYKNGKPVDVAVTIDKNEYMGRVSISLFIKAIRYSGQNEAELFQSCRLYERFKRGDGLSAADFDALCPERSDIAAVYRFIKQNGGWTHDLHTLLISLGFDEDKFAKLCVAMDVLIEMGIFIKGERGNIALPEKEEKVNLDNSNILQKLRR